MQLHDVHIGIHKHKRPKRIGRGVGSGNGKTAGKGHKGHSSRQGYKQNPLMEGGQMPIIRRVPKRGFNNGKFRRDYAIVNLEKLDVYEAGTVVDEAALREKGLVKGRHEDRDQDPGRRRIDQGDHDPRPQVQRRGHAEDHGGRRQGDRDRVSCPMMTR